MDSNAAGLNTEHMAGRGGRGESLRKLLEADNAARRAVQPLGQPGEQHIGISAPEAASAAAPPNLQQFLGRGRARLRPDLVTAEGTSTPDPALNIPGSQGTSSGTQPVQRGRGAGLLLSRSKESTENVPPKSQEPPTRRLARMAVSDRPIEIHRGTSGMPTPMTANYIRLFCEPTKGMFEYFVRYTPEVDAMRMKYELLNEHRDVIGETRTFDGSTLYLPEKLPLEETNLQSTNKLDGSVVNITIKFLRKRELGECVHFYNILFRRIMNFLNLIRFNRSHFNPVRAIAIPQHRLEVWPGLVTAIDLYEDGIMLCCDVSNRVLRRVTAYEIIQTALNTNPANYKDEVFKALVGKSVMTDYNKKLYRIDDIDFKRNPSQTFKKHDKEISYIDYYKTAYGVQISDHKQPLIIHRAKKKGQPNEQPLEQIICLVPELCYMTGLTDEMRADFKVMKDISQATRVTPNQRQYSLMNFLKDMRENKESADLLKRWGLSLDRNTVELQGRVLPPEDLYFGRNAVVRGNPEADWGRAATSNHMLSVVHLQQWHIIFTKKDQRCGNEFLDMMRTVGPQMGMDVIRPSVDVIHDDRITTYVEALRRAITDDLQIVVIIFPSSRDDRYSSVKKVCISEIPVASQVINSRTICQPKKLRSVTQKIALQMNCKMGGTLWAVKIPFKQAMICGIDTYHDPTKQGHSWGGFVASMNEPMTRWYSQTCQQCVGQELIDSLRLAFMACLKRYHQINGVFPETIVMFRDGVGDGQMNVCLEYEIPQLASAFKGVSESYTPKLAFIVVQKRINTRIFTSLGGRADGEFGNPPPGAVMDNTITRRHFYDFFIVSQHVRQGTVSPTHYVVLQNTTKFTPDQLQKITYKMCHLYYNWPGTVRVPAPCQYAHKLAQLIGQNVKRPHSDILSDKLFFL